MSQKKSLEVKKNHRNGNWNVAFLNKLTEIIFLVDFFFNMKVISLLALFENIAFCLCSGCHLCNMMGLVTLLGYSDD